MEKNQIKKLTEVYEKPAALGFTFSVKDIIQTSGLEIPGVETPGEDGDED